MHAAPADNHASFVRTQRAFTEHLRAPSSSPAPADIPEARMAVYRELVYGNIERMVGNLFPVLRKITPDERWFALIQDFFQKHQCHAGIFSKVPLEFLNYVEQERQNVEDPPFLLELVHYEWVDYAATIDPRDVEWGDADALGDVLEGIPVLNPIVWLLAYQFPVHRISPDYLPEEPPATPTYLVVCRDRNDKVGFLELNPVSARLVELLQQQLGLTGRALLERIALELAHPDPDAVVAGGREILERLRAKDVVLGTQK